MRSQRLRARVRVGSAVAVALLVAGCSGGGGGSANTASYDNLFGGAPSTQNGGSSTDTSAPLGASDDSADLGDDLSNVTGAGVPVVEDYVPTRDPHATPRPTRPEWDSHEGEGLHIDEDGIAIDGHEHEHIEDHIEMWRTQLMFAAPEVIASSIEDPRATPLPDADAESLRAAARAFLLAETLGEGRDQFADWFDHAARSSASGGGSLYVPEEVRIYGVGILEHQQPGVYVVFVIYDKRNADEDEFGRALGADYYFVRDGDRWLPAMPASLAGF